MVRRRTKLHRSLPQTANSKTTGSTTFAFYFQFPVSVRRVLRRLSEEAYLSTGQQRFESSKEEIVACWEMTEIWNENVSTILHMKAKLELKFLCITPHAFVLVGGTITNPCIFTTIITT